MNSESLPYMGGMRCLSARTAVQGASGHGVVSVHDRLKFDLETHSSPSTGVGCKPLTPCSLIRILTAVRLLDTLLAVHDKDVSSTPRRSTISFSRYLMYVCITELYATSLY
ncbi:hypothetical protein FA13DRAFT_1085530 [Coprinellus micaceus]|uniref:Uncharacterized protein n=1 Tax=Coprinellus micaceus TaxID=71717 RepID=A0A4Y7TTC6_COPMI|nr:hypothetical protein FA13DRAFT_1085530 [Coprinellus micaceus]